MNETPTRYHAQHRSEVSPFLPARCTRVLEVGCGEGGFAANVRGQREYWGIEPSAAAGEVARGRLDRVLTGTYEQVQHALPADYFDLVICNDVIEHMADHEDFLAGLRKVMVADACMVGSIPNVRFIGNLYELLLNKDWRYRSDGILDRTHLRFFTEKSIRRTLEASGYVVEELRGINCASVLSSGVRKAIVRVALGAIQFGTLGYFNDVRFLQFAFRARRAERNVRDP